MGVPLRERDCLGGTPTKRQVSKRQVSKRPVSKRPVSKRQVYKTSGLQNVRFHKFWFRNVQLLNLIYLSNKKYLNLSFYLLLAIMVIYDKKIEIKHSHHFACKHGSNIICGFPPTTSTEYIWTFFCNRTF
jgi:hypothetical protein